MTIQSGDLVLLASENMNDSPGGGGGLVERVIVSGQSNNIFPDISHLKRTYGGVYLAKIFAAVRTQTAEALLGAFAFIDKIPGDRKLGVSLFSSDNAYDLRVDAAARIENYRAQGGKYLGFLYGTQYKGSQVLTLYQIETASAPSNGDVLFLIRITPAVQQYVRVVSVSSQVLSFTDVSGTYRRKIVTLGIATPLIHDFTGLDISRVDSQNAPSSVYHTAIANAARYYSARPTTRDALLGGYALTVDSIYSQVVPSSQSETPISDQTAGGSVSPLVAASSGLISVNAGFGMAANVAIYLGRSCYPGTLDIVYGGGHIYDNGGEVRLGSNTIGSINYAQGLVTFNADCPNLGGGKAYFKPAGVPITVADTEIIPVTDSSRSFVYTFNITPPPQPGAVSVSYMSQGNWYELRDNGAGNLIPLTDNTGAGTINYLTGSGTLTCASLPDIDSGIILAWGNRATYSPRSGGTVQCSFTKQLAHSSIIASSLVITWSNAQGHIFTATTNSAGVLSGGATGFVQAHEGIVRFAPSVLPAKGTTFNFNYQYLEGVLNVTKVTKSLSMFNLDGDTVTLDVQDTNIDPGSVTITWDLGWGCHIPQPIPPLSAGEYLELPVVNNGVLKSQVFDNGDGGLVDGRPCTISYTTGIITLNWRRDVPLKFPWLKPPKSHGFSLAN